MKKLLTQTLILAIATAITVSTFAQSPNNATRQRRAAADGSQQATDTSADKSSEVKTGKDKGQSPEVTADGKTNRTDQDSEEEAIVPYYNNFFTTYRLGPEDVTSVNVFGQGRYSKSGITVPPSGRISLALVPDGIFVNGKTVDQVPDRWRNR